MTSPVEGELAFAPRGVVSRRPMPVSAIRFCLTCTEAPCVRPPLCSTWRSLCSVTRRDSDRLERFPTSLAKDLVGPQSFSFLWDPASSHFPLQELVPTVHPAPPASSQSQW